MIVPSSVRFLPSSGSGSGSGSCSGGRNEGVPMVGVLSTGRVPPGVTGPSTINPVGIDE